MRLLGDPHLPDGASDESVRIEARSTLLSTAARLLVDGVPAAVRRHEVVNMAGEAIVLLGASDRHAQALHALDAWTQATQTAPFALLDATLALDSHGSWLRQTLPPVAQRLPQPRREVRQRHDSGRRLRRRRRGLAATDRLCRRRRGDGSGAALPGRR